MKKTKKLKIKLIFILIASFVFLFPKNIYAETVTEGGVEYTYVTPDDGNDGADLSDVEFVYTTYTGAGLGARL